MLEAPLQYTIVPPVSQPFTGSGIDSSSSAATSMPRVRTFAFSANHTACVAFLGKGPPGNTEKGAFAK